jgi:hypothetical protein
MAISSILVYEPIDSFRDKRSYWKEYCQFYEQYWGGPTSPYGVWFGNEYEAYRNALSSHMQIEEEEIEDCYFMKDKDGKYYISPVFSKSNSSYSENIIPLDWFLLFSEDDRKSLYTHWGFNAVHYDTQIQTALDRIDEALQILSNSFENYEEGKLTSLFSNNLSVMSQGLSELQAWFSGFDKSGFVVLNYGELCSFLHASTLKNERSVGEMWEFLHLLSKGQLEDAAASLKILFQKWEDIRTKTSGNIDKSTIQ